MFDIKIEHAAMVTPLGIRSGGVLVADGKIKKVFYGENDTKALNVINAQGKYLFPGFIDCHVHFNEPGYDDREDFLTGTRSAAFGGVTTVIDMPLNNKPCVWNRQIMQSKKKRIESKAYIDYKLWGALIHENVDDIDGLCEEGAAALKGFLCEPGPDYTRVTLEDVKNALIRLKKWDIPAGFHCEDNDMIEHLTEGKKVSGKVTRKDYLESRPVEAEYKAVKELLEVAEETNGRVHVCHVSHPDVAELVFQAKQKGIKVTAETCPQYFLLCEDDLIEKGPIIKCSPPVRKKEDAERLFEYVKNGTLDCICSDHSPAPMKEKKEGANGIFDAWGGLSSVQTTVMSMYDYFVNVRKVSPMLLAKVFCENPAKIFGMKLKGKIEEGYDADFTLIDPNVSWEIKNEDMKYMHQITAFLGKKGKGKPVMTMVRGKIIVADNELIGKPGFGKLIDSAL